MGPVASAAEPPRRVDKSKLLLITFFLGGLGAHKIYLRRYFQAAFYPVFFFFAFVTVAVALLELVVYAFTSEDKLNERYGKEFSAPPSKASIAYGVLIIGVFALIMGGVFMPAYYDKIERGHVADALGMVGPWREAIEEHYAQKGALPASPADLGSTLPRAAAPGYGTVTYGDNGMLTVTLGSKAGDLAGKTVIYKAKPKTANARLAWDCTGGTLNPRIRPSTCRP